MGKNKFKFLHIFPKKKGQRFKRLDVNFFSTREHTAEILSRWDHKQDMSRLNPLFLYVDIISMKYRSEIFRLKPNPFLRPFKLKKISYLLVSVPLI